MYGEIYAVIRKYADDDTFDDWVYRPNDDDSIYNKMMELTDGDMELVIDACAWCELACVGEIYEFREGEIEIMEIG